MAGSNNFQQWNPGAANQEDDPTYTSDPLRSGGATSGAIFPSTTANKLFFQLSQMVNALAQMMANKTYNISDANLSNLTTALTNILTNHDVPGYIVRFTDIVTVLGTPGQVTLPGGLIIKWGTASGAATLNVNFSPAFPTNIFVVLPVSAPTIRDSVYIISYSSSGFSCGTAGSTNSIHWVAIGN
jgi:hypothetical protein